MSGKINYYVNIGGKQIVAYKFNITIPIYIITVNDSIFDDK